MRDSAYLARLRRDLERWRAEKMLPEASGAAILADAERRYGSDSPPLHTLSLLAACAFVLGALSLIGANWDRLGDFWQFLCIAAVFNLTLAAAAQLLSRGYSAGGHAAAMAAAAMFGGALILIGQTFSIAGAPEGLLFWWSLGAAAVAIALRSPPALAFAAALVFVWFALRMPADRDEVMLLPGLRDLGALDPLLWLAAAGLAGHAALARRWRKHAPWHVAWLGMWLWLGVLAFLLAEPEEALGLAAIGSMLSIIGGLACALFLAARARGAWGAGAASGYAFGAAAAGVLLTAASAADTGGAHAAFGLCLILSAGGVAGGARLRHRGIVALSIIAFLISAAAIYILIGGSLIAGGVILLFASALIGGLTFLMSRRARRVSA